MKRSKSKPKPAVYFVSYFFNSKKQTGFGSVNMTMPKAIEEYSEISSIVDWLNQNIKDAHQNPCKCVVLNYQRLKR